MKSTKFFLLNIVLLAMVLVFSVQAHAALELLGQGTSAHGTYNLIYDTDFDLTWYDYTNGNTRHYWQENWAEALTVTVGGITYDEWRLPSSLDVDGSGRCFGYSCTESEFGHLYYTELGNSAGGPLNNTGDFQNLQGGSYWLGFSPATNNSYQLYIEAHTGYQWNGHVDSGRFGMAVMGGRAIVPEPISSTLFIVGGATLGFRRFRKKFKN